MEMLNHIVESKALAESSVAEGDDTLKKANTTYHLLQSFNSEVQTSSKNAEIALEDVAAIAHQIRQTEEIIMKAEDVRNFLKFKLGRGNFNFSPTGFRGVVREC